MTGCTPAGGRDESSAASEHVSKREYEATLAHLREARDVLAELRAGYDEYYESASAARLLNVEAKVRDLFPRIANV